MSIERILTDEIVREVGILNGMEPGTEAYKTTVDGICKLSNQVNETKKVYIYRVDKDVENEAKTQRDKHDRTVDKLRIAVDVMSIIVGVSVPVWGTLYTVNCERSGFYPTTIAGKRHLSKVVEYLKPKK